MSKLWKPRDIMIDIETLATRNDAAIIQIGACTLDEKNTFIVSIDQDFYLPEDAPGRDSYTVDPRTVAWWASQGAEAQESLGLNVVSNPASALDKLGAWLKATGFKASYNSGRSVWANGIQFDIPILRYAYSIEKGHNNETPWHYRQEKDQRTLLRMLSRRVKPGVLNEVREGLVRHRADHDCIAQARSLKLLLETIT
jgi:hypothetical protein